MQERILPRRFYVACAIFLYSALENRVKSTISIQLKVTFLNPCLRPGTVSGTQIKYGPSLEEHKIRISSTYAIVLENCITIIS